MTVNEFDEFVALPENEDRLFEFIGGEIVEVPSNPYSSYLASRFGRYAGNFVDEFKLGHVTGEAGGYIVSGERYMPNVAYISKARQPELVREGYNPNPPDLAIEIFSPSNSEKKLRIKLANYLAAGTVVWVAYPETKEIEVYIPGQRYIMVGMDDTLDGGDVLPGFKLAVRDIFAD
jgi:Uma2 family endonuclease